MAVPDEATPAGASSRVGQLSDDGTKPAFAHFEHVERQVALATTTSQLTVAAITLLINAYVIAAKGYVWKDGAVAVSVGILFLTSGAFLLSGLVLALLVAFPNLRTEWVEPNDVRSIFYFRTIAAMTPKQYIAEFGALDSAGAFDSEILRQVWGKSFWLNRMFRRSLIDVWLPGLAGLAQAIVSAPLRGKP